MRLEVAHCAPDLFDGPDRLMAEDPAGRHLWKVVAPANGGGVDHDDGVSRVDHLGVRCLVPTLLVGTVIDECFHQIFPLFVAVEIGVTDASLRDWRR